MRLAQLALSRSDVYNIPRDMLLVREGFNIRYDLGNDDFKELVASIKENGVKKPLTGRKTAEDRFEITDGHRRERALAVAVEELLAERKEAKEKGDRAAAAAIKAKLELIEVVPVISEAAGYQDKDRYFDMAISNSGKPLNLLEQAFLFGKLQSEHQVSVEEIRRRTGCSITHFENCTKLLAAEELHPFIKDGKLTASLAIEIVRKVKDPAERVRVVREGIEKAAAANKSHVTAKHLNESVRAEVAPSKKGNRAAAAHNGSNGNGSHDDDEKDEPQSRGVTPASRSTFDDLLGNKNVQNFSNLFDEKAKVEFLVTTAASKNNGSFFYKVFFSTPGLSHTSPWRYAYVTSYDAPAHEHPRGFDSRKHAVLGAVREAFDFITKNPPKKHDAHIHEIVGAALAGLQKAVGGDTEPPAPPVDEETANATLDDDTAPESEVEAVDHLRRILTDLHSVGGIKKGNERFATLKFVGEYLGGNHTHNQLRAFVLYGSAETRDQKKGGK